MTVPMAYRLRWVMPRPDRWEKGRWDAMADSTGDLRQRTVDLTGDGVPDRVLLLCNRDRGHRDSAYAVVASYGPEQHVLLGVFPWSEGLSAMGVGLRIEPTGSTGTQGDLSSGAAEDPVRSTLPGVTLMVFQVPTVTWYWEGGRFNKNWAAH